MVDPIINLINGINYSYESRKYKVNVVQDYTIMYRQKDKILANLSLMGHSYSPKLECMETLLTSNCGTIVNEDEYITLFSGCSVFSSHISNIDLLLLIAIIAIHHCRDSHGRLFTAWTFLCSTW